MIITDIIEHSQGWHDIRLKNIGGSEVAGLFGVQADYAQSAYTMHMVKSGRIPAPPVDQSPGSRVWFGTRLEASIGAMAAELHGWTIAKGGYCQSDTTPGMACSLDYIITEPGPEEIKLGFKGPGVLQLKNVDWKQHKTKWSEDEPPFPVILQLQHEIDCANTTWGAIVGMVGGNELPAYRYAARERTIMLIRDKVTEFWERVRTGKPPSVDGTDSTAEALALLYPAIPQDEVVDLTTDNELPNICVGWLNAVANRKQSVKVETEFKNLVEEKMKGRKRAICNGFRIDGIFVRDNPGERAGDLDPDKIIGARKGSNRWAVKEDLAA